MVIVHSFFLIFAGGNLDNDSKVACQFFGSHTCTVIRGLDNVRLNVVPEDMSPHLCDKYNVHKTDPIVLSIQFAPDYVLNKKPPNVSTNRKCINL
jgi:hypothetical protein